MLKKLLEKQGETITEALVSILIIALSAAMLATMVSTAVSINLKANAATVAIYGELTAAETRVSSSNLASVLVGGEPMSVTYYGGGDALTSYTKEEVGP